ncbi:hypothetical protein Bca101_023686 [Brassica carinata]
MIFNCFSLQFFADYNSKLLESSNYIARRQAIKVELLRGVLLGDILLDQSNSAVMKKYESSKTIHIEAFHVFKGKSKFTDIVMFAQRFVANQKKPADIINILVANRNNLLRLLADLKLDKEDESFEADKAHVVSEIASL